MGNAETKVGAIVRSGERERSGRLVGVTGDFAMHPRIHCVRYAV